jgi:hypothetical protein
MSKREYGSMLNEHKGKKSSPWTKMKEKSGKPC